MLRVEATAVGCVNGRDDPKMAQHLPGFLGNSQQCGVLGLRVLCASSAAELRGKAVVLVEAPLLGKEDFLALTGRGLVASGWKVLTVVTSGDQAAVGASLMANSHVATPRGLAAGLALLAKQHAPAPGPTMLVVVARQPALTGLIELIVNRDKHALDAVDALRACRLGRVVMAGPDEAADLNLLTHFARILLPELPPMARHAASLQEAGQLVPFLARVAFTDLEVRVDALEPVEQMAGSPRSQVRTSGQTVTLALPTIGPGQSYDMVVATIPPVRLQVTVFTTGGEVLDMYVIERPDHALAMEPRHELMAVLLDMNAGDLSVNLGELLVRPEGKLDLLDQYRENFRLLRTEATLRCAALETLGPRLERQRAEDQSALSHALAATGQALLQRLPLPALLTTAPAKMPEKKTPNIPQNQSFRK